MAQNKDEYVVTNIVKGEGYTAIVQRPILTELERQRRYAVIEDALTDFAYEIQDLKRPAMKSQAKKGEKPNG